MFSILKLKYICYSFLPENECHSQVQLLCVQLATVYKKDLRSCFFLICANFFFIHLRISGDPIVFSEVFENANLVFSSCKT